MILNEFTEEAGYITGRAYFAAEAAFRREQRDFAKLCESLRNWKRVPAKPAKPLPKSRAVKRSCWHCGAHFTHTEKRGPAPKFCSNNHRAAFHRATAKTIAAAVAAQYRPKRPHGGQVVDITGKRFGRLVAVRDVSPEGHRGSRRWLARCNCGAECVTRADRLRNGDAKSCGCLRGQPAAEMGREWRARTAAPSA